MGHQKCHCPTYIYAHTIGLLVREILNRNIGLRFNAWWGGGCTAVAAAFLTHFSYSIFKSQLNPRVGVEQANKMHYATLLWTVHRRNPRLGKGEFSPTIWTPKGPSRSYSRTAAINSARTDEQVDRQRDILAVPYEADKVTVARNDRLRTCTVQSLCPQAYLHGKIPAWIGRQPYPHLDRVKAATTYRLVSVFKRKKCSKNEKNKATIGPKGDVVNAAGQ